jgi:hypothetical protein
MHVMHALVCHASQQPTIEDVMYVFRWSEAITAGRGCKLKHRNHHSQQHCLNDELLFWRMKLSEAGRQDQVGFDA